MCIYIYINIYREESEAENSQILIFFLLLGTWEDMYFTAAKSASVSR